jgi:hypothetical protein
MSRHAVAALDGITGAHLTDWTDSQGVSKWERKALELSEERQPRAVSGRIFRDEDDRQGHDETWVRPVPRWKDRTGHECHLD